MKTKLQWSKQLGTYHIHQQGSDEVRPRIYPEEVRSIQHEAMQKAALIVAQSESVGEAVKNIYEKIRTL